MSGPFVLLLRVLLALALYVFLGLTLWMLWQDLRQAAHNITARSVPAIRLEFRNSEEAVTRRAFSQPEVILGRDPDCDVLLTDPSVSARHALLSFHSGQWWLDDLGSSNGTLLNHERVSTATVLTTGDQIQCGHAIVAISLTGESVPPIASGEDGHNG